MKKRKGFSLLELILVLFITAVLLLIAVPGYQQYVKKSRRLDGIQAIQAIKLAEEKYRMGNLQYGTLAQIKQSTSSQERHYSLDVINVSTI